ncbi:hypothetical protein EV202_1165 [Bacteroides heparinolyticus]|uniref:Uncharacterized protein n=1 Tax=Prevotella heparinolytica TaxID=28113 RepID=A0A4R2LKR3_9BACE|nr:hypothetical protein EV202_1165 [Bacteroides heparinolyticus]
MLLPPHSSAYTSGNSRSRLLECHYSTSIMLIHCFKLHLCLANHVTNKMEKKAENKRRRG